MVARAGPVVGRRALVVPVVQVVMAVAHSVVGARAKEVRAVGGEAGADLVAAESAASEVAGAPREAVATAEAGAAMEAPARGPWAAAALVPEVMAAARKTRDTGSQDSHGRTGTVPRGHRRHRPHTHHCSPAPDSCGHRSAQAAAKMEAQLAVQAAKAAAAVAVAVLATSVAPAGPLPSRASRRRRRNPLDCGC